MTTTIQNKNAFANATPADVDMARFAELFSKVRTTHKAVADFGSNFGTLRNERAEKAEALQAAIDTQDMQKVIDLSKRIKDIDEKLEELPTVKLQNFDSAINAFDEFVTKLRTPRNVEVLKTSKVA